MPTESPVLSLEEYAALDEAGQEYITELVRGVLVREPRPGRRHGTPALGSSGSSTARRAP